MSIRTRSRRLVALNVLALAGGLAACSSDSITNGKGAAIPASAISTATTQVNAIANDPTVTSLFGPAMSAPIAAPTLSRTGDAGALFTRLAAEGARALRVGSSPAMRLNGPRFTAIGTTGGMSIPADMWGKTYVHDSTNAYVVDDMATGAPANGFRIMLYPWYPNLPAGEQWGATAIGYADVMDEGTVNKQKILVNMYAMGGANPVFAFKIVDATVDAGKADTLAGTLNAAGGKVLSYEFAAMTTGIGTASERTVTKLFVNVPGSSFQINGQLIDGLQAGDVQTIAATVGANVVAFSVKTVQVEGVYTPNDTTQITVNDRLAGYLVESSTTGQAQLVHPDGSEMTTDEKLALLRLVQTFDAVFTVIGVTTFFALWAIALGLMI